MQKALGVWRCIWSPNPGFCPQSAAFAEHLAILMTTSWVPEGSVPIVTDCNSVLAAFQGGSAAADEGGHLTAGIWRQVDRSKISTVTKCKAHVPVELAKQLEGEELEVYLGNEMADAEAKKAVRQAEMAPSQKVDLDKELSRQKRILAGAAKLLNLWPRPRVWDKARQSTRASVASGASPHKYAWSATHSRFICSRCQHSKVSIRHAQDRVGCRPVAGLIAQLVRLAPKLGHSLWISPSSAPGGMSSLAFCNKCGCYAELRAKSLRRPCDPGASSQKTGLIKHLLQGRHPVTKLEIEKPYRASCWFMELVVPDQPTAEDLVAVVAPASC